MNKYKVVFSSDRPVLFIDADSMTVSGDIICFWKNRENPDYDESPVVIDDMIAAVNAFYTVELVSE